MSVADVADFSSGSGVFDEHFSVGGGDDDRVVVGGDEDAVEGVVHISTM